MADLGGLDIFDLLVSQGYGARLRSFSAIDRYLGRDTLPFVLADTDAPLSQLARLFEAIRFPGAALADAAVAYGGRDYLFRCPDGGATEGSAYGLLRFSQDLRTNRFYDPRGFYPLLRRIREEGREHQKTGRGAHEAGQELPRQGRRLQGQACGHTCREEPPWWEGFDTAENWLQAAVEGALILSRYSSPEPENRQREIARIAGVIENLPGAPPPSPEEQRILLLGILDSPHSELGFELLMAAGFVTAYWPELAVLDDVDHSKEFHPEGNVWKHTMETFRYRKSGQRSRTGYDPRLSLGLLLHDAGKPLSESSGGHRFQAHAEIGAREARRFLGRLGFDQSLIDDVAWLVKNHMFPAAMPRLPLIRTQEIMEAPLFPTLMELYRCDESSSFKGLEGYYESSAAYQSYLKHRRNPYRTADGKKMGRRL